MASAPSSPGAFEQGFPGSLVCGPGSRERIGGLCADFGQRVLLVIGGSSLEKGGFLDGIVSGLRDRGLSARIERLSGEPRSADADAAAEAARSFGADCVLGVGGGSVLDLAKAAAALARAPGRAEDYLEGLGSLKLPGNPLPWIAAPTTAGTGSECTSNAVLRGIDREGLAYKRSLRQLGLLPRAAILDPDFQRGCPESISLPCAFDALAQLLEPATSRRATPLTDALVFRGLELISPALDALVKGRADDGDRLNLSLAASFSGIGLSGAGLGLTHGIAGQLGAIAGIPHGFACARLIYPCFEASLRWLEREAAGPGEDAERARLGLRGCAKIGEAMGCGSSPGSFLGLLERWIETAGLPPLSGSALDPAVLDRVAAAASYRDSFARLERKDIRKILASL
jgi:alcohol dehydrogenase